MTIAPEFPAQLDRRHAEVVRATLPLIAARIDDITAEFYRRLFTAHPGLLRDRFNRGNQAQGAQQRALAASIATFATHLVDPALPHPRTLLHRIGHKHASLGVVPAEYPIVHEHLFAAIVQVLGADVVTPEIAAAWDRVYWLMADTLMSLERDLYAAAGVEPGDVFRDAVVVDRIVDPSGVVTFVVESPDPLPEFLPGQYISVGVELPDGARQLRQYSLVNPPHDRRSAFAVRPVTATDAHPAGEVSTHLHTTVAVGDRIRITLPFGDLTIDTEAISPLVLVSAGIGITPMIGILEHLAAQGSARRVRVIHADRAEHTHPLRHAQRTLVDRLPAADLTVWYEHPSPGSHPGTVDLTCLDLPADADVYLCGSTGFLQAVRAQLHAAGIPADRVHFELFSPDDWLLD
ncbi:globin domain-containing protein [Nocardia sp. alder85J]|uniref:globin domain-containing protein n=1 Tax=Nocardia sp. alder85J TaxID=2862949 RepID=UPI001CD78BAD|nr:globin domain-containing protein [Nocardia sp. alder85J]MCX4093002.1 globin domain-containing protein [Nocardia sp. alder85J]